MTELEIAMIMKEIIAFCTNKWAPEYSLVQYCIEQNAEGLQFVVDATNSVNELLAPKG